MTHHHQIDQVSDVYNTQEFLENQGRGRNLEFKNSDLFQNSLNTTENKSTGELCIQMSQGGQFIELAPKLGV